MRSLWASGGPAWTHREREAIKQAAAAWAAFYVWAQDQGHGTRRTHYTGPIADDILAGAGITFTDRARYMAAEKEVRRRGYKLAGGKRDSRGFSVTADKRALVERAARMREGGAGYEAIGKALGISDTTVYRMLKSRAA